VNENRVLRGIFGPKLEEVVGGRRRPHNEELRNLYASQNIINAMESRRLIWADMVGKPERDHLKDLSVDGNLILEWILG
jgi:hypothetical protein